MYGGTVAEDIQALIRRATAGEKQAWDTIVEQCGRLAWGVLGKYRNPLSRAEQEDLFQDVFVILLERGLKQFRGSTEHEFRAYLARIVRNEVLTWLRDRGRHEKIEIPYSSFDEADDE
jgi:RNA polymerase sigma factor (sigma-70 family)